MYKILILFLAGGMLLAGCSATSNRYVQKTDKEDRNSGLRYSDDNEISSQDNEDTLQDTTFTMNYADEEDDEEIEPAPEDESIDITEVMNRYEGKKKEDVTLEQSTSREKTLMEIIKYLNTPYKFGGNSKKGIDCSAFTQTIYNNALSFNLLRSAREQYTQGISIDKSELQFGDLVFFNTRRRVKPGHVGIYIGDNLFAHASSKHGVIVSSLDHQYYTKTYMGARRINDNAF